MQLSSMNWPLVATSVSVNQCDEGRSQNTVLIRAGSPTYGIPRQSRDSQTSPPTNRSIEGLCKRESIPYPPGYAQGTRGKSCHPAELGREVCQDAPQRSYTVNCPCSHELLETVSHVPDDEVEQATEVLFSGWREAIAQRRPCRSQEGALHVLHRNTHVIHMLCTVIQSYLIRL